MQSVMKAISENLPCCHRYRRDYDGSGNWGEARLYVLDGAVPYYNKTALLRLNVDWEGPVHQCIVEILDGVRWSVRNPLRDATGEELKA